MEKIKYLFFNLLHSMCKKRLGIKKITEQDGNIVAHITFMKTKYRISPANCSVNVDAIIADLNSLDPCKIEIRVDKPRCYIYIEYPDKKIRQYTGQKIDL